MKTSQKFIGLLIFTVLFFSLNSLVASVLVLDIEESEFFTNELDDGGFDSVRFVNNTGIENPTFRFLDDLSQGKTYIFDESCVNLTIENISQSFGFQFTNIIINGSVTVESLNASSPLWRLEVSKPKSSLKVLNWQVEFFEGGQSGSNQIPELLVLDGGALEIQSDRDIDLSGFKNIEVVNGEFSIPNDFVNVSYGLGIPLEPESIFFINSDVFFGGNFNYGKSAESVLEIRNSNLTIGRSLTIENIESSIVLGQGANVEANEAIKVFGSVETLFLYEGLGRFCATVKSPIIEVDISDGRLGNSEFLMFCSENELSANTDGVTVVSNLAACASCLAPSLDVGQSFMNASVGDIIRLRGKNLSAETVFEATSIGNIPIEIQVKEVIDANTVDLVLPSMNQRDGLRISDFGEVEVLISFADIVLDSATNGVVVSGDEVVLYGNNLLDISNLTIFDESGEELGSVDLYTFTAQDSIGFIAPFNFSCKLSFQVERQVFGQGVVFSEQFDGLFESLQVVTNPDVTGTGSFQEVLGNACDNSTITFDPEIDTFFYDRVILDVGDTDLPPPNNVTIRGNGKDSTILVDRNQEEGSLTIIGLTYAFENVSFQNSMNMESQFSSVFNINRSEIRDGEGLLISSTNSDVSFNNVEFKNNVSSVQSGAVLVSFSTVTFNECDFISNSGRNGGALGAGQAGMLLINGSNFDSNTSTGRGGALFYENNGTFGDMTVRVTTSNFANNISGSDGGALFVANDNLIIDSCSFIDNTAAVQGFGNGGGVYYNPTLGKCVITNSLFNGNKSIGTEGGGNGGGLFSNSLNESTRIEKSTFINNNANRGAGIYGINLEIGASTFFSNNASESGGAIFIDNGALNLLNSTIYQNVSGDGGAIYGALTNDGSLSGTLVSNAIGENTSSTTGVNADILLMDNSQFKMAHNCFTDTTGLGVAKRTAPEGLQAFTNLTFERLYLNPDLKTEGLQSFFVPLSFSPLVNNGAAYEIPLTTAPLNRPVVDGEFVDQIGNPVGNTPDIGGVKLRNAPDPMHVTLLTDTLREGSIRGAELYFNTHYPADTLSFDESVKGERIEIKSIVAFGLALDPAGIPVEDSGTRQEKFLFSDATDITIGVDPNVIDFGSEGFFVSNTKLLLRGLTLDGETPGDTTRVENCLTIENDDEITLSTSGTELENLTIRNCVIGAFLEEDTMSLINSFIYSNDTAGIVLNSEREFSHGSLRIFNNVVGLDENFNPGASPNHGAAGIGFFSDSIVIGGLNADEGNVIAGNDGPGILMAGAGIDILGNYIGVLKDSATIIPNKVGLEISFDGENSSRDNVIQKNIFVGNEIGVLIPSEREEVTANDIFDNEFRENLFASNDTAIVIKPGFQSGISPPFSLSVVDSVITGFATPDALVHIYMDSTDNGSFLVDTVQADPFGGQFSLDLRTYDNLPSLRNVTAMQWLNGSGSSALSRPTRIDCSELQDSLRFGDVEPVCVEGLSPQIEIVAPFNREGATFRWFSNELSTTGFEEINTDIVSDTIQFFTPNDFSFFTRMTLADGCVLTSDTVLQKVGSVDADFMGFEITQDTLEVTPTSQTELLSVISNSPVDSILWSSNVFMFEDDQANSPTLTNFGVGLIFIDLVSDANCLLRDSLFVTYLGEPVAVDDAFTILVDSSAFFDVLTNDINTNDTSLTIISATGSNPNSSVDVFNNGIQYVPVSDFLGLDSIVYVIEDGYGKLDTAIVFINIVEVLEPTVTLSPNQSAVCSNDRLDILFTAENFDNPFLLEPPVWSIDGATRADVIGPDGSLIGITLIPDDGVDTVFVKLDISDGDTTVSDSVNIAVVNSEILTDFSLTLDNNNGDSVVFETGLEVFTCDTVFASYSSAVGNTAILGNTALETGQSVPLTTEGWEQFTISDSTGFCQSTDSVNIRFNSDVISSISLDHNLGDTQDRLVEFDNFKLIDTVFLSVPPPIYGSVNIVQDGLDFTIEYTDTVVDEFNVVDSVSLQVRDVCGNERNVRYEINLVNDPPMVEPNLVVLQVTQTVGEEILISKDTLSSDLNNNNDRIEIDTSFSYLDLVVSTDPVNGVDNGIRVVVTDEIPEGVSQVTVNYRVCDVERCVPGLLTLIFEETFADLDIDDGVIKTGLTNREVRQDSLRITVVNSAVTNNVPLTFKFEWGGKEIEAEKLNYDLVILSRWGDVVYQDRVSGEKIDWNGEYQITGGDQKVPEGNYSWVLRVFFINENGNERAKTESGILYYVNTNSVNLLDD